MSVPLHVALARLFMSLPVEARAQFYLPKVLIQEALGANDIEAAVAILQTVTPPAELVPVKTSLLALLQSGNV
jgi:hypothetical protein